MNVFERKYQIVDNMGRLYTVNEKEVLVVAMEGTDAKQFDILEANKKISASNISNMLRTIPVEKQCTQKKQERVEVSTSLDQEFSMTDIDLGREIRLLRFIQNNLQKYQKDLREQLSAVDEEICDIMHYIELYEYDDVQSLDLIDQIHDCRKRRRTIKDAYHRAEGFEKIYQTGMLSSVLKELQKQTKNLEARSYRPRRLPDLFSQGVKADWKEEKRLSYKKDCLQVEQLEMKQESEDVIAEEEIMYERNKTVFDGRKNDWVAMVNQQAEFFANAQQYMVNLQIDLDELEEQLEAVMLELEDTNCNVTQGYKLYKKVKDLRLLRKEKLEELDKVRLIAECFDCKAMEDAYQYCAEQLLPQGNEVVPDWKENKEETSECEEAKKEEKEAEFEHTVVLTKLPLGENWYEKRQPETIKKNEIPQNTLANF